MAKKYDDYGYEKNNNDSDSFGLGKKILIIAMVIIAIILIIVLIKGCGNTKPSGGGSSNNNGGGEQAKPIDTNAYETALLNGGKSFFNNTLDANPSAPGECSVVELEVLINNKYVDPNMFAKCDVTKTYLKQCVLENGTRQFTPWLGCTDNNSEVNYDALIEGNLASVIVDSTYTEFMFLPQVLKKGEQQLGPVEEKWKDEIEYESYKTLKTTNYYRYRDTQYIWELTNRTYYTSEGTETNPNRVLEYYATRPATGYDSSSHKTTAYKWYTSTSEKEYYMKNGKIAYSDKAVGEYTIKDTSSAKDVTRYSTRDRTKPQKYYKCKMKKSDGNYIYFYFTSSCGSYEYDTTFYTCQVGDKISDSSLWVSSSTTSCPWSDWTDTKCNTSNTDLCRSATATFYHWYKLVSDVRTYYPSGASKASGEKVYYEEAPIKNAIKDTSSKSTVYKWYKESTTTTSGYSATAPKGYYSAKKTSQSIVTDWSDWSTKNPKVSDGRERQIEKKTKIKLQQYLGTSEDGWENLRNDYMTEEDLINAYKDKGYSVNSLEDIVNNGEIKYLVKMYVRNKRR